jgi:hypothetical protein
MAGAIIPAEIWYEKFLGQLRKFIHYVTYVTIMITIATAVEEVFKQDDVAAAAARNGWLNLSAYARTIRPQLEAKLMKDVEEGSIVTALSRICTSLTPEQAQSDMIQSIAVHANLVGLSYERSDRASKRIRAIYNGVHADNNTFLTVTQGINEITIVAEARVAETFRSQLADVPSVYIKDNLVGITAKFALFHLETPNLIYALTRRLAYRDINLVEVVSTATELTFIVAKQDLPAALEQLQKDI